MFLGALMGALLISGVAHAHPMPKDTRNAERYFAARCADSPTTAVKACIHRAAIHYKVSYREGLYVAGRESNFNPKVCNTQGSGACGLFQFMPGTWASTAYGNHSVFSAKYAALGWAWAWARGWQSHWAVW